MEVVADINLLSFVGCTHLIAEAVGYRNLLHALLAVFSFELDIQDEIVLSTLSLVSGDFSYQAHGIPPVESVGEGMAMMVFVGNHRECDSHTSGDENVAPRSEIHGQRDQ